MNKLICLAFFLILSVYGEAATYYVTKAGNDTTGNGSVGTPWLTIGKAADTVVAGDTVIVGDGDYNEYVYETTSGGPGAYITYQAQNAGLASFRGFRVGGDYTKLDGFTIDRFSGVGNTWPSAILINPAADFCYITNCFIKDLPYVISNDFTFDIADQSVNTATGDFVAAGFVVGSKVYLGACGLSAPYTQLWYNNHDTSWTVATVSEHKMTLTAGTATFLADTGTNYWGFIRAGAGNSGFAAVSTTVSGGAGPQNFTFINNRIDNWAGHTLDLGGDNFLIQGNTLTNLNSFRAFSYAGSNHVIRRNIIKDCKGVLYFTAGEIKDGLNHPIGTGWYDYQVAMFSGFTSSMVNHQNVLIEENWFENIENQMGRVDDSLPGAFDITFQRNVFIGVSEQFNGGRDGMKWKDNTFYKCTFGTAAHPLSIGLSGVQTGYEVTGNIFVACGITGLAETASRGWYNIADNVTGEVVQENFVSSEELTGFLAKTDFPPSEGITGGDPIFYSVTDFDGPDNTPYTDDDGLKVLANSPAAGFGGGALGVRPVTSGQPVAHFRVTNPNGWFEPPGDAYDPDWLAGLPTTRMTLQRPWDTPASFGEAPIAVTFSAENSISGVGGATTNTAISSYDWNFGDGTPVVNSVAPTVTHFFTDGGDFTVTLTVKNTLNNTHSYSQVYNVQPSPTGLGVIDVPADYPTVQLAVDAAAAGDTIRLAAGYYDEVVATKRNGDAVNNVTIDGQGVATIKQLLIRHNYQTFRNLRVSGINVPSSYLVYFDGGNNCIIDNCEIDINYALDVYGIAWRRSAPTGSSDNIIQNSLIWHGRGQPMISSGGSRNIIRNNQVRDGYLIDFIRLFGAYNLVYDNVFQNNLIPTLEYPARGNHPDFIQTFGNNGEVSYGHIIERNIIKNIEEGGLSQINSTGMVESGDWTFRNNIFIDIANTASCTMPGMKWYNNTFYRCNFKNEGNVLSFGRRTFKAGIALWSGHPEYALTINDNPSGTILEGVWYRVYNDKVNEIGGIVEDAPYKVRSRNTGRVVYNGIQYNNNEIFYGVAGVTDWSKFGDPADLSGITVSVAGSVVYNGESYTESNTTEQATFIGVGGVTTYTRPSDQIKVYRVVMDFAHSCIVKNNVFIDCGEVGNDTNGWYSFDPLLTGVSADYNYVSKQGFTQAKPSVIGRPIGDPLGWEDGAWYEVNGINGGDPKLNDISNFDFRPLSNSFLVDTGVNISSVNSDFIKTVRPLGIKTDRGAYEYDDGNPPPPPDPDPEPPPSVPTGLTSTAITDTSVALAWSDNSTNELNFTLQRSLNGSSWTSSTSVSANAESFVVTGLTQNTTYYWRIRAEAFSGASGWSIVYSAKTNVTPPPDPTDPPSAPASLTATVQGSSIVLLNWTDTNAETGTFELQRSPDQNAWITTNNLDYNVTSVVINGLSASTVYHWRVREVNANGFSAWSNTVTASTLPISSTGRSNPRTNSQLVVPQ
jgi:hypothetical protein